MMAGALPRGLVLCHQPTRKTVRNYAVPVPPLPELVRLYQCATAGIRATPVIAIALNTFDMDGESARRAVEDAARETGLPAADPVRFGAGPLVQAVRTFLSL